MNIHAPWRMEYIRMLNGDNQGCFLCRARDETGRDEENLLLWRTGRCLVVLNRFPYTGGHSLIAPYAHVPGLDELDADTMVEMLRFCRDFQPICARALRAEGFNIGVNVGRCAGAGLPGHLHVHLVPRWKGDTNFMPVFGDVRVIPQALERLYEAIRAAGEQLGLPELDA